ncbi:F-box domain-containing protein [Mycena kentingensis (nom. inval.)]|nr:F-box domain-containing protein [Mycena kentingensis (nom. inval.)]
MSTASLRAQIAALDGEISAQRQHLLDLETARDALDAQLRRAATFPIDKLPTELMSEVFIHCLESNPWHSEPRDSHYAPRLLMNVCKRWALIAACTPALWKQLRLGITHTHQWKSNRWQRLLDVAALWLRNFKTRLEFDLSMEPLATGFHPSELSDILRLVAANGPKIGSFTLDLTPKHMVLLNNLSFPFDNLEELALYVTDLDDTKTVVRVGSGVFNGMSKLRKVLLYSVAASCVALPWSQITDFHTVMCSSSQALETLHLLPSLVYFAAKICDEDEEDRTDFATVAHPNLRHIQTLDERATDQPHIIRFLALPNLETIRVADTVDEESFFLLLQHSEQPQLTNLDLRMSFEARESVTLGHARLRSLSGLLRLNTLKIRDPKFPFLQTLLTTLRLQLDFLPCLQKLEVLEVEMDVATDDILDDFMWMIKVRAERWQEDSESTRLQYARFCSTNRRGWATLVVPPHRREILEKWKADGLNVHIGQEPVLERMSRDRLYRVD